MSAEILVVSCGLLSYQEGLALQHRVESARQAGAVPDVLLLLEHHPVYTRGRRSSADELPMGAEWYEMQGIEVLDTDRGGRVTYHGPGQLVAYPIVALGPYGDDVHTYVRGLEQVAISSLAEHGVVAETIEGLTGIWVPDRRAENLSISREIGPSAAKIGSIGVHISRGVTTHGLAINVNNDLQPFEWVVPCGIDNCRVTSLGRELGAEQDLDGFASTVAARYGVQFERETTGTQLDRLERDLGTLAS